ncbi:MAG: hypothetical protein J6Y78_15570 [Paludibacteraceae bacterium]|nr:hypothetical protein [Paludibacteraceae bacterium]
MLVHFDIADKHRNGKQSQHTQKSLYARFHSASPFPKDFSRVAAREICPLAGLTVTVSLYPQLSVRT